MKNLTEDYLEIDWSGICEDFDLKHGDITPSQSAEIDLSLKKINKVLNDFVDQNTVPEMAEFAIHTSNDLDNLTVDKLYEIKYWVSDRYSSGGSLFSIENDAGRSIQCLIGNDDGCAHLDGGSWKIIELPKGSLKYFIK